MLMVAQPRAKSDPQIGDLVDGGYYFGKFQYGDGVPFLLFVAPKAAEVGRVLLANGGAPMSSLFDGALNTAALVPFASAAASYCLGYRGGGKSDWYLGAQYEMMAAYLTMKPGTGGNNSLRGQNPYVLPPRASNYTPSDPPTTSLDDFKTGGTQCFTDSTTVSNRYWTSTSADNTGAVTAVNYASGNTYPSEAANSSRLVRPIRRVPA